jgi:hypothetical protein
MWYLYKKQTPLLGFGFIQMRENQPPLLQAAIRIGAAFMLPTLAFNEGC